MHPGSISLFLEGFLEAPKLGFDWNDPGHDVKESTNESERNKQDLSRQSRDGKTGAKGSAGLRMVERRENKEKPSDRTIKW